MNLTYFRPKMRGTAENKNRVSSSASPTIPTILTTRRWLPLSASRRTKRMLSQKERVETEGLAWWRALCCKEKNGRSYTGRTYTWRDPKNPVNIRFVDKISDIRNLSESITSDVMLIYQKWQHWYQWPQTSGAVSRQPQPNCTFVSSYRVTCGENALFFQGYCRCVTS